VAKKNLRLSFGRYRSVTISQWALSPAKRIKPRAQVWFEDLFASETQLLSASKSRLQEAEIVLRSALHKEKKKFSFLKDLLGSKRSLFMLQLERIEKESRSNAARLKKIELSNQRKLSRVWPLVIDLVSSEFGPQMSPAKIVRMFGSHFPGVRPGNLDVSLGSFALQDPQALKNAFKSIEADIGKQIKADDDGDSLLKLVNLIRRQNNQDEIEESDWFTYRTELFKKDRAMPRWAVDLASGFNPSHTTNFYLGSDLIGARKLNAAFGLLLEIMPGVVAVSETSSHFPEPARGGGIGSRGYNLGGDSRQGRF
jgi:hypothetical protein